MIKVELSSNSQAILLLTAPLIMGRSREAFARPLNLVEYNQLAHCLKESGREPADLLDRDSDAILREMQVEVKPERLRQLLDRGGLLSHVLEHWRARSIWTVTRADADYPQRLKRRLGNMKPPVLYGCGDRGILGSLDIDGSALAVVGSRDADNLAIEYAESIGRMAAQAGCTIVSGGARGIDQAAMGGALSESGTAIGVISNGLEGAVVNRDNREPLMDGKLVLFSPYDPRAGFNVGNAMARNKLVYALADAGLVVATTHGKGGTWTGAVEQLDKMGFSPLYARKGDSKGLKALLRRGAHLWPNPQSPDELALVLGEYPSKSTTETSEQGHLFPTASVYSDVVRSKNSYIAEYSEASVSYESPGEALFAKVQELLTTIPSPITDSSVAEHLQVSKGQAKDWLKRLEQEGIYQRLTRPTRYVRVSQGNPSVHNEQ